jgi:hypothetical protein
LQLGEGLTPHHCVQILNIAGDAMRTKRLSVMITEDDQIRMRNVIPWGLVSRVMRLLLMQTLDLIEQHGDIVIGALVSGKLTALDLLRKEDNNESR